MLLDSDIRQYRKKLMYPLLIEKISQHHGTAVDRLIADFSNQNGMNYIYVTHDVQSRFVTHKKEKKGEPIFEDEE